MAANMPESHQIVTYVCACVCAHGHVCMRLHARIRN